MTILGHDGEHYWLRCVDGHVHYGEHGAAGILLRHTSVDGTVRVLMQHRGPGTDHAGSWGWPGGAIRHGETPFQAAAREVREETSLDDVPEWVESYVLDHGGWAYTTFLVPVDSVVAASGTWEGQVEWLTTTQALDVPLVPGAREALWALLPPPGATLAASES